MARAPAMGSANHRKRALGDAILCVGYAALDGMGMAVDDGLSMQLSSQQSFWLSPVSSHALPFAVSLAGYITLTLEYVIGPCTSGSSDEMLPH